MLEIAEDRIRSIQERSWAITTIGKNGDKGAVDRLLHFVPGDSDLLTLETIRALERIGDPVALPKLRSVCDHSEINHGKLNTALLGTIESLEQRAKSGPEEDGLRKDRE